MGTSFMDSWFLETPVTAGIAWSKSDSKELWDSRGIAAGAETGCVWISPGIDGICAAPITVSPQAQPTVLTLIRKPTTPIMIFRMQVPLFIAKLPGMAPWIFALKPGNYLICILGSPDHLLNDILAIKEG
jgi:hypothetical protein